MGKGGGKGEKGGERWRKRGERWRKKWKKGGKRSGKKVGKVGKCHRAFLHNENLARSKNISLNSD